MSLAVEGVVNRIRLNRVTLFQSCRTLCSLSAAARQKGHGRLTGFFNECRLPYAFRRILAVPFTQTRDRLFQRTKVEARELCRSSAAACSFVQPLLKSPNMCPWITVFEFLAHIRYRMSLTTSVNTVICHVRLVSGTCSSCFLQSMAMADYLPLSLTCELHGNGLSGLVPCIDDGCPPLGKSGRLCAVVTVEPFSIQ